MECMICKKSFIPVNGSQKTCSPECRGLNRKPEVQQSKDSKPRGQQSNRIAVINRMAREQGLTYGKLVAKMYAGQVRIEKQ